jgi:hypothetical protein
MSRVIRVIRTLLLLVLGCILGAMIAEGISQMTRERSQPVRAEVSTEAGKSKMVRDPEPPPRDARDSGLPRRGHSEVGVAPPGIGR